jgi:SAM-dependent methyltransferase
VRWEWITNSGYHHAAHTTPGRSYSDRSPDVTTDAPTGVGMLKAKKLHFMVDRLFADPYLAGVYDAWHPREVREDYDFYLPLIKAAGDVLDVGCGTGTLLTEARDAGHTGRLCGLDPALGMLDRARMRSDVSGWETSPQRIGKGNST